MKHSRIGAFNLTRHTQIIHIRNVWQICLCHFCCLKKKKKVCMLEQVGKYRAAPYSSAVRFWCDNKRFALPYCVQPGLLWGYAGQSEWQGENGEQMYELGIVSISVPHEEDTSSILKGVVSRHHLYFSSDYFSSCRYTVYIQKLVRLMKFNNKYLHFGSV